MSGTRGRRPRLARLAVAVCAAVGLSACAAHYAQVPPRVDLAPYGRVALVSFSSQDGDSTIGLLATRRFAELLLDGQDGIEVLEMNPADTAIRRAAERGDPAALAQAIGRARGVPAVFLGQLTLADARPSGHIGAGGISVRTAVTAELSVQLLSTSSGGTMWRGSARADGTVDRVRLAGRHTSVSVRSQEEAYGQVVDQLVTAVTRDLRPSWVKQ